MPNKVKGYYSKRLPVETIGSLVPWIRHGMNGRLRLGWVQCGRYPLSAPCCITIFLTCRDASRRIHIIIVEEITSIIVDRKGGSPSELPYALLQEGALASDHLPKMPRFNRNSLIYLRNKNCNTNGVTNILFRYVLTFIENPKDPFTYSKT